MASIQENMKAKRAREAQEARIEAVVRAIRTAVDELADPLAKNGIGSRKIAMILGISKEEARMMAEEAVQAGRLVAYRGRGGSWREPEEVRAHEQDTWGGRTGHEAGTIVAERQLFDEIEASIERFGGHPMAIGQHVIERFKALRAMYPKPEKPEAPEHDGE